MSIELSRIPLEDLLTALKQFKRGCEFINAAINELQHAKAVALFQMEAGNIQKIETMITKYQQAYLSPDQAKKIGVVKRQFRSERERIQKNIRRSQNKESVDGEEGEKGEEEAGEESFDSGFDFEVESRLQREKGESLDKVAKNVSNIHRVMQESSEMAFKQGQDLDLVSSDLDKTLQNTTKASAELQQANVYHRQQKKCCLWVVLLLSVMITFLIIATVVLW